jgi:hypothetical protein
MTPTKARILLACVRQAYTRLFTILSAHELTYASTLSDAQAALKIDRFNLIMIGTRFDGSRMFDLLRYVKADDKYSRVPVICFRGMKFGDTEEKFIVRTVEMACKEMGANSFFDLLAFADDSLGNAGVRSIINRLLESEQKSNPLG